tara:strand:- start:22913 stop:24223 length:1311 start_codon:yes stop_codon:yes gene_type:complete
LKQVLFFFSAKMSATTQLHQLDNGVRLATVSMAHMASVSVGLWANVGSRHERACDHGMAHLVEHMLFKGTPTRSAEEISRQIEGLGSSIDGFTVEDHTAYHAKAPSQQFEKLFHILADFYRNPTIDPGELKSEKQVIHEEIAMVRDQPSQFLEDLISEATWGITHPLGRSITGTDDSLKSFQRNDVLRFFQAGYCGANTVISVAGNIDHDQVTKQVTDIFDSLAIGHVAGYEGAIKPLADHRFREESDQEQVHVALSFPSVARHDDRRFAHKLLNVILGENMSSRLFQELREQRGLCYEVQSDFVSFADAGLIQIYVALNPSQLQSALETIDQIARDLVTNGVSKEELEAAKAFIVGQSHISLENTSSQMMWAGECLLFFDDWRDPELAHCAIEDTTAGQVHQAAREIFSQRRFASALIGTAESNTIMEKWRSAAV